MDRYFEADARAHYANRHPQIAGGADGDAVLAKEPPELGRQQLTVVVGSV